MKHQHRNRFRTLRQADEGQFVFVYGSLKKGFSNYERTGLFRYACIADAMTVESNWTMRSYGGFPVAVQGGEQYLSGEIYVVDDRMMAVLDRLEGFPKLYDRRQVAFWVDYDSGEKIEAWIYFHPKNSVYEAPESTHGVEILDWEGTEVANWVG